MPEIRYVCLSDTHFGEEDSLLTPLGPTGEADPRGRAPVMEALVACLRAVVAAANPSGRKPTLVLDGDILELALTTDNAALMVFERFIEQVLPAGGDRLFDKLVYVPGNHDHHLWESARETQYANHLRRLEPGAALPSPWHTTNVFVEEDPDRVPLFLLTRLVQRFPHLADELIPAVYPNFGVLSPDRRRAVVFTHGHFIEPLYHGMSTARTYVFPTRRLPHRVWDIEAENFAWIDFFWSAMGRSGEAGRDVELLYEKLQSPAETRQLVDNLADSLARHVEVTAVPQSVKALLLRAVLHRVLAGVHGRERTREGPLSDDAERGLVEYVSLTLRHQVLNELAERFGVQADTPPETTLVFGHTHKPFEAVRRFAGWSSPVAVYNTGGWVVETVRPEPAHGGAVVLVDEALDAVSLRMYREASDHDDYAVEVASARAPGPLHHQVATLIDNRRDPWRAFNQAVAEAVDTRARHLRTRIAARP